MTMVPSDPQLPSPSASHVPRGIVRFSLKVSLWDGIFASVMLGMLENFFTPLALALYATPAQIGLFISLSGLLAALSQWWTGRLARWFGGRKVLLVSVVYLQAAVLMVLSCLPFWPVGLRLPGMIVLAVVYAACSGVAGPIWISLMVKYLPPGKRSSYFGWRTRLIGLIIIASGLVAGFVLHSFGYGTLWGFSLILALAGLCRFVSAYLIGKMYEPPLSARLIPEGRFRDFQWSTQRAPFWPFTLAAAAITFAANLSGPYFAVYMLKGLRFDYMTYTLIMTTVNVSMFTMMAVWGRKADEVGTAKIFRLCCYLTPTLPVLWLLSKSPYYILGVQVLGGFIWSGYNLCLSNYMFDAVPARFRMQAISYLNVANGLALFFGAALGGHLMEVLPPFLGFPFLTLLVISGVLRVLICLFLVPRVPDVRKHKDISSWDIFYSVVDIRPIIGIYRDVVRFLMGFGR